MIKHAEQRLLGYRPEQLFDLVADVERYPEFLPWCIGARIRERSESLLVADLVIGFKLIRERFTSRVTMDRPHLGIETAYADGPFKHLSNCWRFEPTPDGGCRIDLRQCRPRSQGGNNTIQGIATGIFENDAFDGGGERLQPCLVAEQSQYGLALRA